MRRHSAAMPPAHPEFSDTATELGVYRVPLRLRRPGR